MEIPAFRVRLASFRPHARYLYSAAMFFVLYSSNQIIFIGLRSSKDYYKRPGGVVGVYWKGYVGRSVLREWVVRRGGFDWYFGEQ